MNIRQYFDPIPEFITTQKYSSNSFFNFIHFHGETFPDLKGLQIAIIGLVENRGIPKGESIERSASEVRDKLFHLKKGHGLYKIADLGDLKMGQTREESIQIMAVVGEYLIKKQTSES